MTSYLRERDMEVLDELLSATDNHIKVGFSGWVAPMECGGSNGSDHSYRLSKLARVGVAEQKQRSAYMSRGSKVYRITEAGRSILAAYKEATK